MMGHGNGTPAQCAQNLLKIIRGEVPYARIKGLDRTLIDRPSEQVKHLLAADMESIIGTYEPRISVSGTELTDAQALQGIMDAATNIK